MNKTLVTTVTTVCIQMLIAIGFITINYGPGAVLLYGTALALIYGSINKYYGFANLLNWIILNTTNKEQQERLFGHFMTDKKND